MSVMAKLWVCFVVGVLAMLVYTYAAVREWWWLSPILVVVAGCQLYLLGWAVRRPR